MTYFYSKFITVLNRSWKVSTCKYSLTKYNPKILWQLPFLKQSESYILKNNCKAFISQHTTSWANASGKRIGTWVSFSLSSCWDHLSTKHPFEYSGSYVLEFSLQEKETENWSIDAVCSCHRIPLSMHSYLNRICKSVFFQVRIKCVIYSFSEA